MQMVKPTDDHHAEQHRREHGPNHFVVGEGLAVVSLPKQVRVEEALVREASVAQGCRAMRSEGGTPGLTLPPPPPQQQQLTKYAYEPQ